MKSILLLTTNYIIGKIRSTIAYFFIRILMILLMLYILDFIFIAIENLSIALGIYEYTGEHNESLHHILQYFQRDNLDIANTAGIVALILLGLLLLGIFKAEKGIMILPFLVDPSDENFNGKAIAEMLIAELKRIKRIHAGNCEPHLLSSREKIKLSATYPTKEVKEKVHFLQINPEGENLAQSIEAIGTIGFGSTSIPIGSILILLRNICPGADPGLVISGCLQKSGSDICLISYMKLKNSSWSVCKETENTPNISNEELSTLVSDLSYNIYFELLQLQSKLNVHAVLQNLHIESDPSGIDTKHVLPSWKVLKYFTEAIEALQTYNITRESNDLARAGIFALKAARVDPYYNDPLYLLYNVGIAYLNNLNRKDYYEAERLARYIVALRPDSSRAWYSWGLTLRFLALNKEAIECYDKALLFDGFVEEEKDKIEADIHFMKAVSLRDLKHYDEAIKYFNYYFEKESDNGYAWGHYGITLEAKAKLLDDETLRDDAERAFRKAIVLCPDFVSVHAALARIYLRKMKELPVNAEEQRRKLKSDAKEECLSAQKYMRGRKKQNEYNRACFEINCGDKNKAQELLKTAINENQFSRQWIEEDPDWDSVRDDPWFTDLLDKSRESTEDTNELISKIAIRRKLDKEDGRDPYLFYDYDINDPEDLAKKLLEGNDNVSKFIRKYNPETLKTLRTELDRLRSKLYVFNWEKIPGDDDEKLKKYLSQNFDANWVKNEKFERYNKGKIISNRRSKFLLELNREKTELVLKIDDTKKYLINTRERNGDLNICIEPISENMDKRSIWFDDMEFFSFIQKILINENVNRSKELENTLRDLLNKYLKSEYVFNWEKIPGDDDEKLKKFLSQNFDVKWVKNPEIKKNNKGKTINITDGEKSLSLELNDERVILKIDGTEKIVLIVDEMDNDKLNICKIECLYEDQRFAEIKLSEQIKIEAKSKPGKKINRILLKAAYPEIGRCSIDSELGERALKENFIVRSRLHAASGDVDTALTLLFWALDNKQISSEEALFEPDFEFIRDNPRFTSLVDRFSRGKRLNS